MPSFKSPLKEAGGGEGSRCIYPVRLDTYGRGCAHDCAYCYAKSLLSFRDLWHPEEPASADFTKIRRKIWRQLRRGDVVRLGGMTDCFQPAERWRRVTYRTIRELNRRGVGYLIVTKSALVADSDYMALYDPELAHFQVTITATDDAQSMSFEKASPYSERKAAVEKLSAAGFDAQVRLSPFLPEFVDMEELASIKCDKVLVEFLRANAFIKRALLLDYSRHSLREGNYEHLPLERKLELLETVKGFEQVSVCEDVEAHYAYFRDNVNSNPRDCCNLRRNDG